jgi:nicotinamidase-related amidase
MAETVRFVAGYAVALPIPMADHGTIPTDPEPSMPQHSSTALLMIDVQESFRHRPAWREDDAAPFLDRCNALIDGAGRQGIPIVRVLHTDEPAAASDPFSMQSGFVRPLAELRDFDAALQLLKTRHSALVATPLPLWLHAQGIRRLIVAGIRTEQCCETTTRHASDEGWAVDFVSEATLTFEMKSPAGRTFSAADLRERTETVLAGRFATICSVEQALARAAAAEQR